MALFMQVGPELHLHVKVMPGSGSSGVAGERGDELLVRLFSQPEKGKANRELLEVLGAALGVPRTSLRIVRGELARHKVVALPVSARAGIEALVAKGRLWRNSQAKY